MKIMLLQNFAKSPTKQNLKNKIIMGNNIDIFSDIEMEHEGDIDIFDDKEEKDPQENISEENTNDIDVDANDNKENDDVKLGTDVGNEDSGIDDEVVEALAIEWKEKGLLPDDFQAKDIDELKSGVYSYIYEEEKKAAETEVSILKEQLFKDEGISEEALKVAKIYINGGDPNVFDAMQVLNNSLSLPINEDDVEDYDKLVENRKNVIRTYLRVKGENEDDIESRLEYIVDNDKDEEEAKKAVKKLKEIKRNYIAQEEKKIDDAKKNQQKKNEKLQNTIKDIFKNEDWGIETNVLTEDFFTKTEFLKTKDKEGKTIVVKVPKVAKILKDNNIRIVPLSIDSDEDVKKYIKAITQIVYGDKKSKTGKKSSKKGLDKIIHKKLNDKEDIFDKIRILED